MSLRIIGTGSCVPELVVHNKDLEKRMDTSDEWITTRTGIKERHVCTTETAEELASQAAVQALESAGVLPEELDYILCGTIQGDFRTPSLACLVQKHIGASCPAFDLNAACSGFVYALDVAAAYLESNRAKKILVVCTEIMSRVADWNDRSTCILFGDGAGAVVLEKGEDLLYIHLTAAGESQNLSIGAHTGNSPYIDRHNEDYFLHMNGQEIYKFAVSSIGIGIESALGALSRKPEEINFYLLHQANHRIIEAARQRLSQPPEKFPFNIDRYGNTSSASLPILLDELNRAGTLKSGDLLLMSAFGAGLTTGTCVIRWG